MNPEPSRPTLLQSTRMSNFFRTVRSDIESAAPLNNKHSEADTAATESQRPAPVHPEFAFADGNVEIKTTDQKFWVHEYHLSKFAVFANLIQEAKSSDTTSDSGRRFIVACDKTTKGEDICNTLKVVYASHIDGIPDFDSSTLTSTLRIATSFDYPALRKFAISKLEGMDIPATQRIQLSDELSLPEWELPAFTELCSRVEPISHAEAEILGMTRFVEVARIRETERTRWKVKDVDGELLGNLLQAEGSADFESSIQEGQDPEYCSGRSKLPLCNCWSAGGGPVVPCGIHLVTPQVLEEGKLLLKQRHELLEQLASIRTAINRGLHPTSWQHASDSEVLNNISKKLSKAPWVRKNRETEARSMSVESDIGPPGPSDLSHI